MGTLNNTKNRQVLEIEINDRISNFGNDNDDDGVVVVGESKEKMQKKGGIGFDDVVVDDYRKNMNEKKILKRFLSDPLFYLRKPLLFSLVIAFGIFLAFAIMHDEEKARPLVISSGVLAFGFLYYEFIKKRYRSAFMKNIGRPFVEWAEEIWQNKWLRWTFYGLSIASFVAYLAVETAGNRYRLMSLLGLVLQMALCYVFSTNRSKVVWRPVIWGVAMQFVIGLLVLRWPLGFRALSVLADKTVKFLDYAQEGTRFVYGFLAFPPNICGMDRVFAFSVIQTLLYFGSIIAVLYYFGIIQYVLRQIAWIMQFTMGTTAAESLNAAGCVFLGMTEGPLMIRPYFQRMTASELHTVFASGFACIAGSLFIAYISFGACPIYLLSASVMSAPASIAVSKLLLPETEESKLKSTSDLDLPPSEERNVIEAVSQGAQSVVDIVISIVANLLVFVALLAFVNNVVWWMGDLVGYNITFDKLLGYLFFPLAFVMGASDHPDWSTRMNETFIVAQLMGTKTAINEFIAYKEMGNYTASGALQGRAQMIATFALCGFSNIGSLGIQLGTIGGLCPEKKPIVARIIFRALVSGAVACFTTACVAGLIVADPIKCMPELRMNLNCTKV